MEAVGLLLWLVLQRAGTSADEQVQLAPFDLFLEHPKPRLLTRVEDFIERVVGLPQLDGRPFVVVPKRRELIADGSLIGRNRRPRPRHPEQFPDELLALPSRTMHSSS